MGIRRGGKNKKGKCFETHAPKLFLFMGTSKYTYKNFVKVFFMFTGGAGETIDKSIFNLRRVGRGRNGGCRGRPASKNFF